LISLWSKTLTGHEREHCYTATTFIDRRKTDVIYIYDTISRWQTTVLRSEGPHEHIPARLVAAVVGGEDVFDDAGGVDEG